MGSLGDPGEIPDCPVCGGPCMEDFERSDHRIPDRLPPEPKPPKKRKRKGRRMQRPEHHEPHGPEEDRMRKPSEDR